MTFQKAIEILEQRLKEGPDAYDLALYRFRVKYPKLFKQFENSIYQETFEEIRRKF